MAASRGQTQVEEEKPVAEVGAHGEYDVDSKQFRDILEEMEDQVKDLFKLGAEVARLEKGARLQFPSGQEVGRREMRTLEAQFVKRLRGLVRYHVAARKPKRQAREKKPFTGFGIPIYISEKLQSFFRSVNLGPAYQITAVNDKGQPSECKPAEALSKYLQLLLEHGITARGMLTPLFNIYIRANQMQYQEDERTYLRATPEMKKFFQEEFDDLRRRDLETPRKKTYRKKVDGKTVKLTRDHEPFNPDKFHYSDIMRILAYHWVPVDKLTEEQKQTLANAEVREHLLQEQKLVSDTNACYRAKEAPAKKDARAARRRTGQVGQGST